MYSCINLQKLVTALKHDGAISKREIEGVAARHERDIKALARQFVEIAVSHRCRGRDRSDRRQGKFVRAVDPAVSSHTAEVKEQSRPATYQTRRGRWDRVRRAASRSRSKEGLAMVVQIQWMVP